MVQSARLAVALCCGLLGCIPRQQVEVPLEIRINRIEMEPQVEPEPARTIHWTINRKDDFVSLTEISPGEIKYTLDTNVLMMTALKFGIIQAECNSGVSALFRCEKDGGSIHVSCYDIELYLTCQVRENGQPIPKKEKEPPQEEEQ